MNCDKCTRMAMKIACKANGVNSVAIEGSDRDQLVVIGEGVDSANLTCSLRKKLCYAALWSVDEVKAKPKPEEKPKPEVQKPNKPESTSSTCSCGCPQLPICPQYAPYPMLYEARVYDYTFESKLLPYHVISNVF
nr:heavy metal-associated isoprenylated plant protein 47 [Quercus suber]